MDKPKIMIAAPMVGKTDSHFLTSVIGLRGIGDTKFVANIGSLVYNARSELAARAIQDGFDYILWLDSDMVFEPDLLEKLYEDAQQGMDYVTGIYFRRVLPTTPILAKSITWERDKETGIINHGVELYKDYPKDSVFEIAASGFGCVLMKTELVKHLAEACAMSPFGPMPKMGEDFSFCWRAGKMGIKMYCDSRVKAGHIGTFLYTEETYLNQVKEESK